MLLYYVLYSVAFFSQFISAFILEQDSSVNIQLLHALKYSDEPIFTERGNITISSLRTGSTIDSQVPLSAEDKLLLKDLAAHNKFYQVKSIVTSSDGTEQSFITTLKACMLAEAQLNDGLSVSLDYNGKIIGVTSFVASSSTCEGAVVPTKNLENFVTTVYVRQVQTGATPDTASYIQKLEKEREARQAGEGKDNRSFLAKYWMYIVPIVIVMVISSAANPDAGAGQ